VHQLLGLNLALKLLHIDLQARGGHCKIKEELSATTPTKTKAARKIRPDC
jgi:hypothetical protein